MGDGQVNHSWYGGGSVYIPVKIWSSREGIADIRRGSIQLHGKVKRNPDVEA